MRLEGNQTVENSFRSWLADSIQKLFHRGSSKYILWCDPKLEWPELLKAVAHNRFELWADASEDELLTRTRFYDRAEKPQIIWLPKSREHLTWFKVFELEADAVWEQTLLDALRMYGVQIEPDHERDLHSLLPVHALEWLDQPKIAWKALTPANAMAGLVDEDRILQVLAGNVGEFKSLTGQGLFTIFARRIVEEFGLPEAYADAEEQWRIAAAATLLSTEAAHAHPEDPPSEGQRIVPCGNRRNRCLKLLRSWQENVHYMGSFEILSQKADATTGLMYWARNLAQDPKSFSSRIVEETLFKKHCEELEKIEQVDELASELDKRLATFIERSSAFWCNFATHPVGWNYLTEFAKVATLLVENQASEESWRTPQDIISWYIARGWQIDEASEMLFEENAKLPPQLHRIRTRLRRAYLRSMDRIASSFSEMLSCDSSALSALPSVGQIVLKQLEVNRNSTAIVFLDACRLELAFRMMLMLNEGEPAKRASLLTGLAPIPSITSLGMAFALPMDTAKLKVHLTPDKKGFRVTAENFKGDLTQAEQRRQWLSQNFGARDFLTVAEVLDSEKLSKKTTGSLLIVNGIEIDEAGHEGQLQLTGAHEHIERYVHAIRKLREFGFNRVIVTTDHGFFHWQPAPDEIEETKPEGDIMWTSRRAIVGNSLTLQSGVKLKVPQSNLDVVVPRSFNAFKTYGGLGFFHGGATVQELVIPVMIVDWPLRATKPDVTLKPVQYIATEAPRVQIEAAVPGQVSMFGPDANWLSRRIVVRIEDPKTGKVVFKHDEPATLPPGGGAVAIQLRISESPPKLPYGSNLIVIVRDADDEDVLAREDVTLKVEIDEW